VDGDNKPVPSPKLRAARAEKPLIPEVDAYLHLLVLLRLIDTAKASESRECSGTKYWLTYETETGI